MSNDLRTGVAWLGAQLKPKHSDSVTYQRGLDSVSIKATLGASQEESLDESGAIIRTRRIDFIVTAADLILDGVVVKPLPGDRIVDGTKTYEVLAIAGSEIYREEDPFGLIFRIHARLIDE